MQQTQIRAAIDAVMEKLITYRAIDISTFNEIANLLGTARALAGQDENPMLFQARGGHEFAETPHEPWGISLGTEMCSSN